ncbi:MAG: glycosyltransferase [gamma proteobacterium endosymbiont of Lamellibrachia anaximandri]|nr:glycosyltransferase [gamma proteobacterium endosymbiont of Lamellibrachia anaximandri]MBL3534683.1 glycosyltransferase [gamma proteobacterium endosymbiont of Lamellibrachia anaximandri]
MTEQTLEGSPDLSVVIPVYNEEAVLPSLFSRLYPALDALGRSYEIIFIDDGSRDRSVALLRKQYQVRPEETRVVCLRANAGQHAAIIAGFEQCRGSFVVTLDADLQNPPEEIGKLLAELDKGHDYVGSIRRNRQDSVWRDIASKAMNRLRERITNIHMTDQGCMLRGYDRDIINAILDSKESNTFIPALAYLYSGNPIEVVVEHEERAAGESKYPLYKLIHLNFDLMTGFSLMPLQVFSLVGVGISIVSFAFVLFLVLRRLIVGPEVEGVFTLFAIVFFLIGILLFGIGLLGEYVGRIYVQARGRPRYLVRMVLEKNGQPETGDEA